jgi:hypothetical protein
MADTIYWICIHCKKEFTNGPGLFCIDCLSTLTEYEKHVTIKQRREKQLITDNKRGGIEFVKEKDSVNLSIDPSARRQQLLELARIHWADDNATDTEGEEDESEEEENHVNAWVKRCEALTEDDMRIAKALGDKITPNHYSGDSILLLIEEFSLNFNLGNVIKYAARGGKKNGESKLDDLKKASFYIRREIELIEKGGES